jgi:hypothetical protein
VEPAATVVCVVANFCHDEVRASEADEVANRTPPAYSRRRSVTVVPGVSDRSHALVV